MIKRLDSTQGAFLGLRAGHVRRSDALVRRLDAWAARDAREIRRHPTAHARVVAALRRAVETTTDPEGEP